MLRNISYIYIYNKYIYNFDANILCMLYMDDKSILIIMEIDKKLIPYKYNTKIINN